MCVCVCVWVCISSLCVCVSCVSPSRTESPCMGVRLLHSLCVYVIFYVIFVPRYQFGAQGLTWWPVINFYSSAACAVAFTTGNYVAGRPVPPQGEPYIWLVWVTAHLLQRSDAQAAAAVHRVATLQSSFELLGTSFRGFKLKVRFKFNQFIECPCVWLHLMINVMNNDL